MARTKQTAKKSTGGLAPRKKHAKKKNTPASESSQERRSLARRGGSGRGAHKKPVQGAGGLKGPSKTTRLTEDEWIAKIEEEEKMKLWQKSV